MIFRNQKIKMKPHEKDLRYKDRQLCIKMNTINQIIDGGTPFSIFKSYIEAYTPHINLVKFGWGSSIIDPEIVNKIKLLKDKKIPFNPGGTLFEYYYYRNKFDEYDKFLLENGFEWIELSRGTISIDDAKYSRLLKNYSTNYSVLSEIGYKSTTKSDQMTAHDWVQSCQMSIESGADLVVIEARESGTAGIVDKHGNIKDEIIKELILKVGLNRILFEAPTKELQTFLINNYGSSVNLGNISIQNVLPLVALRQNLRSDTLNSYQFQ